ncbi:MAG: hypothetical protein NT128_01725 [Proteobacteria bacterium]|nr:hypothetical protein [Pseudomonadota bacterium]
MLAKLNIELSAIVALVFVTITAALYGSTETALDIMDNHINATKSATQNVTADGVDLKKEIEQLDMQYLQGMAKYHSYLSCFWNVTNKFSGVANILATIGTTTAAGMDFYYRQHDLDSSSGNSKYNSASFAFCLAAFGTNLLQLVSFRMYNRSEGMRLHLRKAIESENVLETFRQLEGEDLENSEVRVSKAKEAKKKAKKAKKDKKIKCTSAVPWGDEFSYEKASINSSKAPVTKNDEDRRYLQNLIRHHSCLVRVWRAINGFVEGGSVFTTIGATVATGIDFYYRQNNLAGSSENSAYNNASLVFCLSSLGARVLQFISFKMYNKSERIHVNLRKALYSENALEMFRKLEKDYEEGVEKDEGAIPPKAPAIVLPQIVVPKILNNSPVMHVENKPQEGAECSEIVISRSSTVSSLPRTFSRSSITHVESKQQEVAECSEIVISQVPTEIDTPQVFRFEEDAELPKDDKDDDDCKQM